MTTQLSAQKRRVSPLWLGFLGIIVVPTAIVVATNSWVAPDAAAYVRMAFGGVLAAAFASASAWWLAVSRNRSGARDRTWFWGVAVIVTLSAIGKIAAEAERLTGLINQ